MSVDRAFLDTNVIIYLISSDDQEKRRRVEELLITEGVEFWISTQVLNEMAHVLRRKFQVAFDDLEKVLADLVSRISVAVVEPDTIMRAIRLGAQYGYHYFDCLMIASALETKCSVLYTEDLHDGHRIDNALEIRNPFAWQGGATNPTIQ